MKKILNIETFDIFPYERGFIYAKKLCSVDGKVKISYNYFLTDFLENRSISRSTYLLGKFGEYYKNIANQLGDYVTCERAVTPENKTIVVYPSGEYGIFSSNGIVEKNGDLSYNGEYAHGICIQKDNFWSVVPNNNCIIRHGTKSMNINMRIGGGNFSALDRPENIAIYDNELFISCAGSKCVKTVDLKDYSVRDYILFDEPVWKYLRTEDAEIVLLNSGVYILS